MRDWRTRLDRWVRVWDQLPELTRDCFPVRPPVNTAWPAGLPSCPALADFYARCGGGTFGAYSVCSVAELQDPAADAWLADSPGLDPKPGRWILFAHHEHGHVVVWDADADDVLLYSPDDMASRRLGRTMAGFLERLFYPSAKASNETTQMWAEALAEADRLD